MASLKLKVRTIEAGAPPSPAWVFTSIPVSSEWASAGPAPVSISARSRQAVSVTVRVSVRRRFGNAQSSSPSDALETITSSASKS